MADITPAAFIRAFLEAGESQTAKASIELSSVDDTSDADKPISDATALALANKTSTVDFNAHVADVVNPHAVTPTLIGLGSVDNTADADKPTSTATQAKLDDKASLTTANSFAGQIEMLGQLATTGDSAMNRDLSDARYTPQLTSVISVLSLADLPAPVADVITLADDNTKYIYDPLVDIGANRFVITGAGVIFEGVNVYASGITSTNAGVLITCTDSFSMVNMTIVGFGTHGLSCTDAGTSTILLKQVAFMGFTLGLSIDSYASAVIDTCSFMVCTNGVAFANTITNGSIQLCIFTDVTGKLIDLDGCTSSAWNIVSNIATLTATSTFLTVAVNSGNISAGGQGTISANKLDNTLNGTPTAGYTAYDTRWTVIGNSNISNSDVLAPTGWGNYEDSVAGTIALSTTPAKLTVNSLGTATDIASLPVAMVDASTTLWDSTNHKITPATLRDSYVLRVQIALDSVSGNPLRLVLDMDIGGGASPTIIVASDNKSIRGGSFPQTYLFSFPFFCKETFVLNGGQLFLSTDTGTAVLGERAIFIERISSGVR